MLANWRMQQPANEYIFDTADSWWVCFFKHINILFWWTYFFTLVYMFDIILILTQKLLTKDFKKHDNRILSCFLKSCLVLNILLTMGGACAGTEPSPGPSTRRSCSWPVRTDGLMGPSCSSISSLWRSHQSRSSVSPPPPSSSVVVVMGGSGRSSSVVTTAAAAPQTRRHVSRPRWWQTILDWKK